MYTRCFLLLLCCFCEFLFASDTVSMEGALSLNIGRQTVYFTDDDAALKLKDILELKSESWRALNSDKAAFGIQTTSTFWFKFTLGRDQETRLWLEIDNPALGSLDLYVVDNLGNLRDQQRSGRNRKLTERAHNSNFIYFPLYVSRQESLTYVLKLTSQTPIEFKLTLRNDADFQIHLLKQERIYGVYFGLMFALMMINLLLFIKRGEVQYIYYVLATLSSAMLVATMQGYSLLYIFDAEPWITLRLSYLCVALFLLFSTSFTISFLDIASFNIKLYRVGHLLSGFCVLLIVWVATESELTQSTFCFYACAIVGGYSAIASVLALRERVPGATEFLAANVLLVASAVLATYPFIERPESALFSVLIEFGTVAQSLLLSVALAAKTLGDLNKSRESAEAASVAKSEFLATMSREVRTAINGVVRILDLMLLSELSAEQRNKAFIARFCSNSLLMLVNNILDLSRIQAGKITLEETEFSLHQTLAKAVESMQEIANDKSLKLILDVSHVKQPNVVGDSVRLYQIVSNLINNAVKFTHNGEVVISAYLAPAGGIGTIFTCRVLDTGIGNSTDQQTMLLDSSNRADSPTTRMYGGTQLGLSIAKELTQLMGGSLSLTSEPDKGSSFEFSLLFQPGAQLPRENRL